MKRDPQRLTYLNTWFPAGDAGTEVTETLRSVTLLEEMSVGTNFEILLPSRLCFIFLV